ncbi:MAG: fumarylacetoacetate hydrolase family protein, partial [Thermoguttaceae bacterium]|nr:fumarylacetoacetate hydrolase family protein [Thermoguttaceae bacterium]
MRLTVVAFDGRSSLAVWSEIQQGWILISDLLKGCVECSEDVSITRLLSGKSVEESGFADLSAALEEVENGERTDFCVYSPGVNCEYGSLFSSPQKILCVGLNYADHAREFGDPLPTEPVVFNKAPSALSYSGSPIVLPSQSNRVDYEGELVVVIGKEGRAIPKE